MLGFSDNCFFVFGQDNKGSPWQPIYFRLILKRIATYCFQDHLSIKSIQQNNNYLPLKLKFNRPYLRYNLYASPDYRHIRLVMTDGQQMLQSTLSSCFVVLCTV